MNRLITLLILLLVVGLPVLGVVATVQTCGWKGLFVECRIVSGAGS